VGSPWQLPLPQEEYTQSRVVIYFYSDRWIPIACFHLSEAITLYRKASRLGKDILVFPPGLNLETKNILTSESPGSLGELPLQLA
jgi:hypothetical protein